MSGGSESLTTIKNEIVSSRASKHTHPPDGAQMPTKKPHAIEEKLLFPSAKDIVRLMLSTVAEIKLINIYIPFK